MKVITNNTTMDPIKQRMARGRKIAQMVTIAVVVVVGLTAMIYPEVFRSEMKNPTPEELAEAKKKKLTKPKKAKRRLSKKDIDRLAKLRKDRARQHMMNILKRLEKRILIAEKEEQAMTAKFRNKSNLLESLQTLAKKQTRLAHTGFDNYVSNVISLDHSKRGHFNMIRALFYEISYDDIEKKQAIDKLLAQISKLPSSSGVIPKIILRKLKSARSNLLAFEKKDRNLAVRGHAAPEDHPLTASQRKQFSATIYPMEMDALHKLSQDMAEYYKNLQGDIEAGKFAEIADISLPEALDKLAHEAFDKDDLEKELNEAPPETIEGLDKMTNDLREAERSAERALTESGGEVPSKSGKKGKGKKKGEGDGQGEGDEGDSEGNDGKGGGKGFLQEKSQAGPPTSAGQRTDDEVLRSLAFQSGLGVAQDMTQVIQVNKEKVLANVISGRRYSKKSQRKGYLYIDTWHIIGPWDAEKSGHRQISFAKIYPPEKKANLDARYTSGKTERFFDDERGYGGKGSLSGKLSWKFCQSPTVEVRIPRPQLANDALYFAYTEVYFDEATEMNLAIASDDAARIRVNGNVVFEDTGLSPYVISEQVRKVKFKKGVNKILVRLVNGTGPCRFSLLLLASENE